MHAHGDRSSEPSPQEAWLSPEAGRSAHALGPPRAVQSPWTARGGRSCAHHPTKHEICPPNGGQRPRSWVRLSLTHPPVVFGPHRSPRGGGRPILGGCSCNIWITSVQGGSASALLG